MVFGLHHYLNVTNRRSRGERDGVTIDLVGIRLLHFGKGLLAERGVMDAVGGPFNEYLACIK